MWLPNVTLFSENLIKGRDVSFSVYNLFNRHYGHPRAEERQQNLIEQNGRTGRLKLTYRF